MSSEESLLSLWDNRKGLEDDMCEDLNAYGQLAACKYPQAKSCVIVPVVGSGLSIPTERQEVRDTTLLS